MSAKSDAIEQAVAEYLQARTAVEMAAAPRTRARADRAFARLAAQLAPRIRYFTRHYGLADVAEDAEQVCAIALHRAAERYDPARARFTTYINWQLRAELQALRLRLYGDQRRAGRLAPPVTLSLDQLLAYAGDDWLVDPEAQRATEQGASDGLAHGAASRLVRDWARRREAGLARTARGDGGQVAARVAAECALIRAHLAAEDAAGRLSEADRHVVRRALADMTRHMAR